MEVLVHLMFFLSALFPISINASNKCARNHRSTLSMLKNLNTHLNDIQDNFHNILIELKVKIFQLMLNHYLFI